MQVSVLMNIILQWDGQVDINKLVVAISLLEQTRHAVPLEVVIITLLLVMVHLIILKEDATLHLVIFQVAI